MLVLLSQQAAEEMRLQKTTQLQLAEASSGVGSSRSESMRHTKSHMHVVCGLASLAFLGRVVVAADVIIQYYC